MRAMVLREYGSEPRLERVAVPVPGPGEALVRVEAAGMCATDLKVVSGALRGSTDLPLIPGHEVAGTVVEAREQPDLVGSRVAIHLYDNCGTCVWCRDRRETLCPNAVRVGIERDGGLAEYVVVASKTLIPFAEETSFEAAAVAMDAVTTPWGALHTKGKLEAGQFVLIVGCGGLGSNAVQIAASAGAHVAVLDPAQRHRQLGLDLGAELAVAEADLERIREWSDGGVHLALETSGRRGGFDAGAAVVRSGGRVVCNGYHPGIEYGLDSSRLVLDEIQVLGSRVANRSETARALAAVERGEVRPQIMETLPLEAVPAALERLASGGVEGRLVIKPGGTGTTDDVLKEES